MSDIFGKASDFAGGAFFKPADHVADIALLVEPISIEKGVSSTYQQQTRLRDEVTADVAYFATVESIENGEPTGVLKGVKFVHGMLTGTLERNMGKPFLGVIRMVPTKAGSGYAFRDVDDNEHVKAVTAYYVAREEQVAADLADAPGFD